MAFISDIFQRKRLDKEGINIRTQYIVGHEILERNTDGSRNDEIASGIRCRKDYFVKGRNVHSETFFDSRIEYSFVAGEDKDKQHKCPNCGMSASVEEFTDGCPYCGSHSCKSFYTYDEWGNACYDPTKCESYNAKSDPCEYCQECGKKVGTGSGDTCVRFTVDTKCPECSKSVKGKTCHSH